MSLEIREQLKKTIGKNIRSCRKKREITLRELSRRLEHKGPASLSNIESGKALADLDTLYRICKILRIKLSTLMPDPQKVLKYKVKRLDIPKDYRAQDKLGRMKSVKYEE